MTGHPANDEPRAQPQRTPAFTFTIGAIFVTALVVTIMFGASAAEQLLFGWLYFPLRVVDDITVDWPSAILGCVCVFAFVFALDRTIRWFIGDSFNWSLQSSLATSFAVVLLFGAGIAMVGLTHQTIWLFTGRSRGDAPIQQTDAGVIASAQIVASRSRFRNRLKMTGLGAFNYSDVFNGLPPGGTMSPDGTLLHGWAIRLGPFTDFSNGDVDFTRPWDSEKNAPLFKGAIPAFLHPSISTVFDDQGFALSHVAANSNVFPMTVQTAEKMHYATSGRSLRGLGDTILFGTVSSEFRPWGHPANIRDPSIGVNQSLEGFGGPSGDGANFVMGDGSVRFLSKETDLEVLRQLSNPDMAD